MSIKSWLTGTSGDWTLATGWTGGVAPGAGDTAMIAAPGSYIVTLFGSASVGGLTIGASGAEFYDAGSLALSGTLALNAGTLALAYGTLAGGTLAVGGGRFLSTGGTLDGTAVQGTLDLSAPSDSLFVRDGMALSGVGGTGSGSIALTGGYAALEFLGSQTLSNATVTLGASGSVPGQTGPATLGITHAGGATSGATLTLGSSVWLRQSGNAGIGGILAVGNTGPVSGATLSDTLVNQGTITAGVAGAILDVTGTGTFVNQGAISVSNGATLEIATSGFANTGLITVLNATLALGGTFSTGLLSSLGTLNLGYGTGQIQVLGTADTGGGTLSVGFGSRLSNILGQISLAGTLLNGTVLDIGGGFGFLPGTGVLDGTTYVGLLNLSSAGAGVTLTDNAHVSASGGAAGSIADTGAGSALWLRGTETLDNATVTLGNASATGALIGTSDAWLASSGTTATLGAHLVVQQAGTYAALQANGWSPVPGLGVSDTLVNQGSILANVAGGRLLLSGYGTFINQGNINVAGGDALAVTVGQFANTGTITDAAGGTILLGQTAGFFGTSPAWSNAGQIAVTGGTLVLAGGLRTGQLGTLTETSGSVQLAGTLSNAGATLSLGTTGGAISLQSLSLVGTILGGTIADATGLLSAGVGGGAVLDGVSYAGTLALTQGGAFLRIRDGLTLSGMAEVLGAGSVLDFTGGQTIGHGQILLGAMGSAASLGLAHDPTVGGADTLTLGSLLSITQAGALATIGQPGGVAGDTIVNAGTITASVAGGTFTLGGPGFVNQGRINVSAGDTLAITAASFSNTGTIVDSGGLVSLDGSITLAGLGQISLGGGILSETGTLDLGGGTLQLGTGSAIGRLALSGTIRNGTIVDAGLGLGVIGNATLDGVTYRGVLDLSRPFAQLAVAHGLTVAPQGGSPGTIMLTGAQTRLLATTTETFDSVGISLGSVSQYYVGQHINAPELAATAGVTLTLGAASTLALAGTAGTLGDSSLGQWTDSIVNAGQISAASPGTLTLGGSFFTNNGTISATGHAVVTIGDTGFANTGMLAVGTGSALQVMLYNYYAAPNAGAQVLTNTGTIALAGGILQELTAGGLFPAVPLANLTGGDIEGYGLLFAQVSNAGTIEAHGGLLQLAQPLLGTGSLLIDPGATLEVETTVATGQRVGFVSAGGTLQLDSPSTFTGTLTGFGAGDAIDLPSQILTGVGLSSGTLVLSNATQNFRLLSTTPLGGAVAEEHDIHGGALVHFVAQSYTPGVPPTSPPVVLAVDQPNMLFWTSPAGDVLQGSAANVNGAHVSNWSAADSIDITDLSPATASLTVMQTVGLETIGLSDGVHTLSLGLTGSYTPSSFHVSSDGHGGSLLTYGHS